jgi:hypothetical protein
MAGETQVLAMRWNVNPPQRHRNHGEDRNLFAEKYLGPVLCALGASVEKSLLCRRLCKTKPISGDPANGKPLHTKQLRMIPPKPRAARQSQITRSEGSCERQSCAHAAGGLVSLAGWLGWRYNVLAKRHHAIGKDGRCFDGIQGDDRPPQRLIPR